MVRVFKVSPNVAKMMIEYYKDYRREKTPPYAIFQADSADVVVTLYESNKAMFQGISADIEAQLWIDQEKHLNNIVIENKEKDKKKKEDKKVFYNFNTIGSDEVGTGDYFGPIVVSATFVSKENIEFLENLGVRDSKKITDEKIIDIAPKIIKKIPYTTFILTNSSYNSLPKENLNMNKIKAVLHNKVLIELIKKEQPIYEKIVIDEFCSPKKFYEYINDAKEKIKNVTFMTKAEDQVMSVAASSIISRYIFLKEMKKISDELNTNIPFGANSIVDEVAKNILNNKGEDELKKYVKYNFKNTEKIKG
ncbi:MAG: ribonuclease HIII [Bacilli bacterium]|nr:ribonuclease HIII [Bacilli bacterium]